MNVNRIDNNKIKVEQVSIPASLYIPAEAVLKEVSVSYKKIDDIPTKEIEAVKYTLTNPATYDTFKIKVPASAPIVTKEQLESASAPIIVSIPVNDVKIKPYSIEYGKYLVSIIAPSLSISPRKSREVSA